MCQPYIESAPTLSDIYIEKDTISDHKNPCSRMCMQGNKNTIGPQDICHTLKVNGKSVAITDLLPNKFQHNYYSATVPLLQIFLALCLHWLIV